MGNRKKGFSLLELLIYMALLSIVVVVVVEIFLSVTSGRSQNEVQSFVDSNLRFAIDKIESDLRSATSITTPASGGGGGQGTVGSWSNATALPSGIRLHSAVLNNGYIYTTGGFDGALKTSTIFYAAINSTGSVGAWSTTTPLPSTIYKHSAVVNNGYIYTTGGFGSAATSTVYYAQINSTGSIGNWTSTTALPSPLYYHSAIVNNGYIYTTGGLDSAGVLTSTVLRPNQLHRLDWQLDIDHRIAQGDRPTLRHREQRIYLYNGGA